MNVQTALCALSPLQAPLFARAMPPPKGTSLGTALFVVAFLVWCAPIALRDFVGDYVNYVRFGQWIQFVTIYFRPWQWMHNCEFEKCKEHNKQHEHDNTQMQDRR